MAIIKYIYLFSGIVLYIALNILSYTHPSFIGAIHLKVIYSLVSLILLALDYITILKTEWIMKKPFKSFSTYTKIMLYLGVIVIPLISLYYES
jgi:uncharacterized membrane protein YidH (DUF202 family)